MKAAAVIPAYNEVMTVGLVVEAARLVPELDEVIVVCDGCSDGTAQVARASGAKVIELRQNVGKGAAMITGAASTFAEVILFIDADLIGLRPQHLTDLVRPVLRNEADMTIGLFSKGRFATDLAQVIAPYLSGQRAIKRELLSLLGNMDFTRYGVEMAITTFARQHGWRIKEVELPDLTHIMKEEKLGLVKGVGARMRMYWEIAKCLAHR